ncbi:MAG: hypothetical protein SPI77_05170 [Corynebacterium sp.]|nr:hypothetical protein [Corynebacterium sp.]
MKFVYILAAVAFGVTGITYIADGRWGWGITAIILACVWIGLAVYEFKKPQPVEFTEEVARALEPGTKAQVKQLKADGEPVKAIKLLRESVPGLGLAEAKHAVDEYF